MKTERTRARYSEGEIRALITRYEELLAQKDTTARGIRNIVLLVDLERALERLPWDYWEVVLLHGLLGIPQAATARLLQVSQPSVSKRFRRALEEIEFLMNGGD
jgi:DNA-directed RNA polymerase specialized sigma24 family protein